MSNPELQDLKINIKFKLSALWTAVMFCYIYGDFFSLFVPGRIKGLMAGQTGAGPTTPAVLLAYAIMLSLPPLMIILSLVIGARASRLINIITGIFFTAVMALVVGTSISSWMLFYIYLGVMEMLMTISIIVLAWKWPHS